MKKLIVIIAGLFLFAGCASIRTDSSNPSLQSPITTPSEKLGYNLELGSSDRIKFTDDASARPPKIVLVHSRSNDVRANLLYGINQNLDISAGITSSAGLNLASRLRLMGDQASVWSMAGTFFLNFDNSSKSGDQLGEFGPSGYNWKADASSKLAALGVAIGYRSSENLLLIANAGVGQTTAKLEIKQDPGTSDPGANYSSDTKAALHYLGAGAVFGRDGLVTLGVMYTRKQWKDASLGDTSTTHAILKLETR